MCGESLPMTRWLLGEPPNGGLTREMQVCVASVGWAGHALAVRATISYPLACVHISLACWPVGFQFRKVRPLSLANRPAMPKKQWLAGVLLAPTVRGVTQVAWSRSFVT